MRLCYFDCFDDSYDINFLIACVDFWIVSLLLIIYVWIVGWPGQEEEV